MGDTDGDVPVTQSTLTKSAEAPEATQEAPLGYSALFHPPRGGNRPTDAAPPRRQLAQLPTKMSYYSSTLSYTYLLSIIALRRALQKAPTVGLVYYTGTAI